MTRSLLINVRFYPQATDLILEDYIRIGCCCFEKVCRVHNTLLQKEIAIIYMFYICCSRS